MSFFQRSLLPCFIASLLLSVATLSAQSVWIGQGGSSNWSDPGNWQNGEIPDSTDSITFQGGTQTSNFNDLGAHPTPLLTFDPNAASFFLQGDPLQFADASAPNQIVNNSPNQQVLAFSDSGPYAGLTNVGVPSLTINAAAGDIVLFCNVAIYNFDSTDSAASELIFTGNTHTTTVEGSISNPINPADVVQLGGTTVFLNNNSFTGNMHIFGGELLVGNTNALGLGDTVLHGGTLATFEGPRSFTVGHDYIQTDGTLRMQIGGVIAGVDSDLMNVNHDAFLGGELFLHRINGYMPVPGDRVTILQTFVPCTVNNTWDSVLNDFPGLIQPTVEYFPDHADVVFDFASTFAAQARTPNQSSVGRALDHAVADQCVVELTNLLGNVPVADLPSAYDAIAPEELASIYSISFSQATVQTANLQNRMADIRAGSTGFCANGFAPVEMGPSYTKDGKTVLDKNPSIMTASPDNRWGVFITGTGELVSVDDNDFNAEGYDITTGGFTTGFDYRLLKNWAIGVSAGYSHSEADTAGDGQVDVDGGKIGLYTTFFTHGFYFDAAAQGGWNSIDTRRDALFADERGSTDGAEFAGFIGAGHDWKHNCWIFGPTGTLQYTYAEFDGFTEGDTTLARLHFPDQDQDSLRSTIGFHLAHEHVAKGDGVTFRPEVRAAWLHEYFDKGYNIDANLVGCEELFTVKGAEVGRDSAVVNGGVTAMFGDALAAYLFYTGQFGRDNYADSAVSGGLRFSW